MASLAKLLLYAMVDTASRTREELGLEGG